MTRSPRARLAAALVAACLVGGGVAIALGGDEGDEAPTRQVTAPGAAERERDRPPRRRGEPAKDQQPAALEEAEEPGAAEGPSGPPPASADERAAAAAVRSYVRALSAREGQAVCAAFAPGALAEVDFPRRRGSCAATLRASLAYRDPRGLPVWRRSLLAGPISARIDGDRARVTATVVTRYADQRLPSIEDDVVYLTRAQGTRWLIAQPSITLYRAIGAADVPPSALAPPAGWS